MIKCSVFDLNGRNIRYGVTVTNCENIKKDLYFDNGDRVEFYECKTRNSPIRDRVLYNVINGVMVRI